MFNLVAFNRFRLQNYYKKMEVPNKMVKKTIYARINEFFVQFSWSLHVSANVISEGTHPVGEGACRNTAFGGDCANKLHFSSKINAEKLHIPFFCTTFAHGTSFRVRKEWLPPRMVPIHPPIHSSSLPVDNDGRTTVERRSNDSRAKTRQHSNGGETAVTLYHNVIIR